MPENPSEPPHLRLVGPGLLHQFAADLESGPDLVLDLLRDEELHPLLVPLADHLLECRHLIVLAAQTQHQHGTGIGMLDESRQGPLRIGMVVT